MADSYFFLKTIIPMRCSYISISGSLIYDYKLLKFSVSYEVNVCNKTLTNMTTQIAYTKDRLASVC
jgi:hypothetical protein